MKTIKNIQTIVVEYSVDVPFLDNEDEINVQEVFAEAYQNGDFKVLEVLENEFEVLEDE